VEIVWLGLSTAPGRIIFLDGQVKNRDILLHLGAEVNPLAAPRAEKYFSI
jgi:hypothetical protein